MTLTNSLQWPAFEAELLANSRNIKDVKRQREARKVITNIGSMVSQLSRFELEARRSASHSLRKVNEQLTLINAEITNIEQWITLLMLS